MKLAACIAPLMLVGAFAACGGSSADVGSSGGSSSGGSSSSSSGGSSTSSSGGSSGGGSSSGGCDEVGTTIVDVPVPIAPNGGRCGGVYAVDMACAACVNKSCCAEESACGTSAACVADLECTLACSSADPTCSAACDAKGGPGASTFDALRSCVTTSCASECSTLDALTFDCDVVCVGHGPANRNATSCRVLDPTTSTTTTLVECTFDPLPCDVAGP